MEMMPAEMELDLRGSELERVFARQFADQPNLFRLDLSDNKLRKVGYRAFFRLRKLNSLDLSENEINKMEWFALRPLCKLEHLDMSYNRLPAIFWQWLAGARQLTHLNLCHNQIEKIGFRAFASFKKLEYIDLSSNKLSAIGWHTFRNLWNIQQIRLMSNQIEKIDRTIFRGLDTLVELNLSENRLSRVDANWFKGLVNLRVLNLSDNLISEIEENAFKDLALLEELYLNDNKLKCVSDMQCFSWLKNVAIVDLHNNPWQMKSVVSYIRLWRSADQTELSTHQIASIEHLMNGMSRDGGFCGMWSSFLQQFSSKLKFDTKRYQIVLPLEGKTIGGKYRVGELLGQGAFGRVFSLLDKNANPNQAMKVTLGDRSLKEINLLIQLDHPNVVKYFDHFELLDASYNQICLCIVTEFCGKGDLAREIVKRMRENISFEQSEIVSWIMQALNGLKYLHAKNIIHRDIKPANMLMSNDGTVKICDLGISKLTQSILNLSTYLPTLAYVSPELYKSFSNGAEYSTKTDVWSIGCAMFEIMFMRLAFPSGPKDNPPVPDLGNSKLSLLLKKMLVKDPKRRASSQVLYSQFVEINKKYFGSN